MLLLFFLIIGVQQIFVSDATQQACGKFNETQFYNQQKFLAPGEYPWLGRVGYQFNNQIELRCLAVLISDRHAILPAHCARDEALTMVFKNSKGLDWTYTIEEMAVHPDFSPSNRNQQNDIAVATLTKDVQLSEYTQPICLPPSETSADNYVGQRLEVAGFPLPKRNKEKTESSEPDRFLKVQAQIASEDHCKAKYGAHQFSPTSKQICGYVSGDENVMSGAPLMALTVVDDKPQNIYLVGIISFGLSIKSTEHPDVFTRILPYKEWIQRNTS